MDSGVGWVDGTTGRDGSIGLRERWISRAMGKDGQDESMRLRG